MPKSKKKQGTRKNRHQNRPSTMRRSPATKCLEPTNVKPRMSDDAVKEVIRALIVIADDFINEIPYPYSAPQPVIGRHQLLDEVMFFFPDVKTEYIFPVWETRCLNGEHFTVVAYPDTEAPLGEIGLMYVCRRWKQEPNFGEIAQFVIDCHDTRWVVKG